jgi:hypothetical protein
MMGKSLKYVSMLLMLFFCISSECREIQRPLFTPVNVGFRLLQAPRIKAGSVTSGTRGSLSLANRRWGVVEITYRPRFAYEAKGLSKKKNTASGLWLDDVTCGVRVVAVDRQNRKAPALALFSTRVDFWTIPLDWAEHKYFVYIPPMLIERVMPSRRTDSKVAKVAVDNDFVACVTFFHKKWGVLGEGYYGLKSHPSAGDDFRELMRLVPQENVFHGSLVSRANSPWGLNDQNQFDLEKPAFIPAPLDEAAIEKAAQAAAEESVAVESSRKKSSSAAGKKNKKNKR